MATATLGLLGHTEIDDADANTDWTNFDTADPDIKKEGSNAMAGILRADLDVGYCDKGTAPVTAADKHARMWINTINVPYMEDEAGGGYEFYMYDGSSTQYITVFSSDDYFGGWFNIVIDCNLYTSLTLANVQRWGIRANHTSNAKNANNTWVDFLRYSDGYYITGATSFSDPVTLADVAIADRGTTTLYGYGIIEEVEGVYLAFGELQLGNSTTTTYFEMDGEVLVFTDQPVADGLYTITGNGSGANIRIIGSTILAAGSNDNCRFDVDFSTDSPNDVDFYGNVLNRGGTFLFASGQDASDNTYANCDQVTTLGADVSGSSFIESIVAADTGALYWNASYTDTYIDNCDFTMGSNSHHAIDFGTSVTSNLTLRNCDFNGFGSTDDSNDSTIRFLATSGSLTLSLENCRVNGAAASASNFSVDDAAGITVTVSIDPVTVEITCVTKDGTPLEDIRAYGAARAKSSGTATTDTTDKLVDTNATFQTDGVAINDVAFNQTDGTSALVTAVDSETSLSLDSDAFPDGDEDYRVGGAFPVEDTVTIVNSGTTATVTHTGHGMASNDYVYIEGGSLDENEGVFQITYINANSYSYTMASSPGSSPTGTITSTFVALYGLSDVNGEVSTSRVYATPQPIRGWARNTASGSPYYQEGVITGTISSTAGFSGAAVLVPDE